MASLEQLKDQSMNRRTYDGCKTGDDLRVTTGPGRYQLDVPPQYCNACYAPEPTVRQQMWGASLSQGFQKTDVESDLLNLNRPTTRTVCDQYNPEKNKVNAAAKENVKECSFPQTFSRLVDPPCNNRAVGWNRWEWLCDNPQESVMLPFDNLVTTRLQKRDQHRPCIPVPQKPDALLPAPISYEKNAAFDAEEADVVKGEVAAFGGAFGQFNPAKGIRDFAGGPSASYSGYENELLPAGPF
jgi:hypothetical protein